MYRVVPTPLVTERNFAASAAKRSEVSAFGPSDVDAISASAVFEGSSAIVTISRESPKSPILKLLSCVRNTFAGRSTVGETPAGSPRGTCRVPPPAATGASCAHTAASGCKEPGEALGQSTTRQPLSGAWSQPGRRRTSTIPRPCTSHPPRLTMPETAPAAVPRPSTLSTLGSSERHWGGRAWPGTSPRGLPGPVPARTP
eukprot:scaffold75216_cov28-Tisochrysis_lutea.AAC.3